MNLKKELRRLLSLVLTLTLVFGFSVMVEASEDYDAEVTPLVLFTGKEKMGEENRVSGTISGDSYTRESVIKIEAPSAGILNLKLDTNESYNRISANLFLEPTGDQSINSFINVEGSMNEWEQSVVIPKKGTYYVRLRNSDGLDIKYDIEATMYTAANKTLKNKQTYNVAMKGYSSPVYYKIVVKEAGIIKITYKDNNDKGDAGSISLSTKSGKKYKKIASSEYRDDTTTSFAVDKGTYYATITGSNRNPYTIKYVFNKVNDRSGNKMSNARTITKGAKAQKGLLTATKNTVDWYKFKVKKDNEKFKITTNSKLRGYGKIEVYDAKGSRIFGGYDTLNRSYPKSVLESKTIKKGTYYIKISKDGKESNGTYNISIK